MLSTIAAAAAAAVRWHISMRCLQVMTFDPCAGAYVAYVAEDGIRGTSLTFNESTQVKDEHPTGGVVGGVVTVIAGRGAGQVRLLSIVLHVVLLDIVLLLDIVMNILKCTVNTHDRPYRRAYDNMDANPHQSWVWT